jgi:hypothetical protein
MANGIEMVFEMASQDSNWSVLFPPPIWNGIQTTEVVTSGVWENLKIAEYVSTSK